MNKIAAILKESVVRLARKQVRAETQALRKASGHYRKVIADLSLRVKEIEKGLALLRKQARPATLGGVGKLEEGNLRFSAKGFRKLRKKLGLSAAECGMLLGVSTRAVGQWERGEKRPKVEQLGAVGALRKIGKREARQRVEELSRS